MKASEVLKQEKHNFYTQPCEQFLKSVIYYDCDIDKIRTWQ